MVTADIQVASLPSAPLPRRSPLPHVAGIYFVMSGGTVYYIGRARSLVGRLSNHHRRGDFEKLRRPRVAWIPLDYGVLDQVERELIQRFQPRLNRTLKTSATRSPSTTHKIARRRPGEQIAPTEYDGCPVISVTSVAHNADVSRQAVSIALNEKRLTSVKVIGIRAVKMDTKYDEFLKSTRNRTNGTKSTKKKAKHR